QAYRYFQNFTRDQVRDRLRVSHELEEYAKEKLIAPDVLSNNDHVVCVHTRRGDFITDNHMAHSTKRFVVPAVRMMEKRIRSNYRKKRPLFVLIGNDRDWMKDVIRELPERFKTAIATSNKSVPAGVDWDFARQYCDSVLLTASASTFGWWLGYHSKGSDVYYNTVSSKPGGKIATFAP
ncbi:hypothetical protein PFISCL1PPCAC_3505, partial [Pristionchus fissidentatus]